MKRRRSRVNSRILLAVRTFGMARKCSVKNCEIDDEFVHSVGLALHKFPRDPVMRCNWLINCGFEPNYRPQSGEFICYRHFRRNDYEKQIKTNVHRYILKKGSLPTVFDGYNNHPDPIIPLDQNTNESNSHQNAARITLEIIDRDNADSPVCLCDTSRILSEVNENCSGTVNSTLDTAIGTLSVSESPEDSNNKSYKNGFNDTATDDVHDDEVNENDREEAILTRNESTEVPLPTAITISDTNIPLTKNIIEEEEVKDVNVIKSNSVKQIGKDEKLTKDEQRLRINRTGLKFFPDAKLEAKDFNEKWYVARVVETDWVDREVLIHFDKWSSRFDEWIPMDSSRLRVPQMSSREPKMRGFSVGEKILATWADGRKYPAKVNAILGNDRYDVLFDDGYAKVVRSSKMTKVASSSTKVMNNVAESEPYIGSKQERRDKKRKHTVMELFQHKRKTKVDGSSGGGNSVIKKEGNLCINRSANTNNINGENGGVVDDSYFDSELELLHGFENTKPKIKNNSKRKRDQATKILDTDHEDDTGPEWIDGEPQGIESFVVDGNDGSRRSIIVHDKKLPPGWQKHFIQRKTGSSAGKWDVLFLHKLTGKKFRSRNDIRLFFEAQSQIDFDPDMFDFCIHRRKRLGGTKTKFDSSIEMHKKIKTILPKAKVSVPAADNLLTTPSTAYTSVPTISPTSTPADDSAVFIGRLRVEMEDSAYKCPKQGCFKTFRKENLLQMHIKHYHPEYSKYLGTTPNVADLAYARTIGESLLDITPKRAIHSADRGGKFEKRKIGQDKSLMVTQFTENLPSLYVALSPHANSDTQSVDDNRNDNMKFQMVSSNPNTICEIDEEISKISDGNCAMSPGTLFDMRIREVKTQVGIKTLLPVRSNTPATNDIQRNDRSKSIMDNVNSERAKNHRKRQLSEYSSDISTKSKKRHVTMQELTDSYMDLDNNTLDAEGPASFVYRFSRRKSDTKRDDTSTNHGSDGVMTMINGELVKVEQLRREEIINCTCGFMEEDGLMIQCDLCLCWQHGHCNAIEREKDVPEKYICFICRHPYRQRTSKKYIHDHGWIKEGTLPSLSERTKNQAVINQRTAMLKRSYDLISVLLQIQHILQSLRVKINVAQKKNHPKLYLWAKNWDKSDIPTPNVDPVPILEMIKSESELIVNRENSQQIDSLQLELKPPIKDDLDVKSIASDTELMKILEEDVTTDEIILMKNKKNQVSSDDARALTHSPTNNDPSILKCNSNKKEKKIENIDGQYQKQIAPKNTDEKIVNESENLLTEKKVPESKLFPSLKPFIPEPEAAIDLVECRVRLQEHIVHFQNHIEARLTAIEAQLIVLEVMDEDEITESIPLDVHPRIKQTIQMLLRDLNTVRKLAALC